MQIIIVTIFLMISVGAPLAMGACVLPSATGSSQSIVAFYANIESEPVFWAQNDTGKNEKTDGSKSGAETKKSKSTDDDKSKTSKSKSKPLKPFVPSEKIPGEQAVDFPVDI